MLDGQPLLLFFVIKDIVEFGISLSLTNLYRKNRRIFYGFFLICSVFIRGITQKTAFLPVSSKPECNYLKK